jgi:hypothetical protein
MVETIDHPTLLNLTAAVIEHSGDVSTLPSNSGQFYTGSDVPPPVAPMSG